MIAEKRKLFFLSWWRGVAYSMHGRHQMFSSQLKCNSAEMPGLRNRSILYAFFPFVLKIRMCICGHVSHPLVF